MNATASLNKMLAAYGMKPTTLIKLLKQHKPKFKKDFKPRCPQGRPNKHGRPTSTALMLRAMRYLKHGPICVSKLKRTLKVNNAEWQNLRVALKRRGVVACSNTLSYRLTVAGKRVLTQ